MMKKHGLRFLILTAAAVLCLFSFYAAGSGMVQGVGYKVARSPASATAASNQSGTAGSRNRSDTNTIPIETGNSSIVKSSQLLKCKYYRTNDFMSSVTSLGGTSGSSTSVAMRIGSVSANPQGSPIVPESAADGMVAGGIVPHHLVAGKLIAAFFQTLSESKPETLIVIAPNHRRVGHESANTSLLNWNTPFGTLETQTEMTKHLILKADISRDNTLMEEEHSISSLVPYIKYFMPDVKLVPILLHGNYSEAESKALGRQLASEMADNPHTFLVASVDFSHYLEADKAEQMDKITLDAIRSFDITRISPMGNDNLDSPPSMITLLTAMKEAGDTTVEVTGHNNSFGVTGKEANNTTSYYTMLFKHTAK